MVSLLSNVDRCYTQCDAGAYSVYLEQKCVYRVDVRLAFKYVIRNEKVYTKCKSEKIPEADWAPRNKY